MVAESKADYSSEFEAIEAVAPKLGIGSAETLRKWIRRAEVDARQRPGTTTDDAQKIKDLKKENADLRRARDEHGLRHWSDRAPAAVTDLGLQTVAKSHPPQLAVGR